MWAGEVAMPRYEYTRIDLNTHHPKGSELDLLSGAGAHGWRLVCINVSNVAFLIREIVETPPPPPPRRRTTKPEAEPTSGS